MAEHRVPVVVEVILERVTNVSMGTEIDNVVEFEELALVGRGRPDRDRTARLKHADAHRSDRLRQVQGVADRRAGRRRRRRRRAPGAARRACRVGAGRRRGRRHGRGRAGRGIRARARRGVGSDGRAGVTPGYARRGDLAVVEMADVAGLVRLPGGDTGTARPRRAGASARSWRRPSPRAAAPSCSASAARRAPTAVPGCSPGSVLACSMPTGRRWPTAAPRSPDRDAWNSQHAARPDGRRPRRSRQRCRQPADGAQRARPPCTGRRRAQRPNRFANSTMR